MRALFKYILLLGVIELGGVSTILLEIYRSDGTIELEVPIQLLRMQAGRINE